MLTSAAQKKRQLVQPYDGPYCPRCDGKLTADWIRTGTVRCPDCSRDFEATAFTPPAHKIRVAEVATVGPDGANACANHARNIATTSCTRCGLFICPLCDLNVGTGSICPSCFDRAKTEGSLPTATKTRDWYAQAKMAAIVGIVFGGVLLGPLFGTVALYYQAKGRKQIRMRGDDPWDVGSITVMIISILLIAVGAAFDVFVVLLAMGKIK